MRRIENERELMAAAASGPVVVLFHATWCPFCRSARPVFERLSAGSSHYQPLEAVIDDETDPLWERFAIEVVPTVLFFKEGREVGRLAATLGVGLDEEQLRQALPRRGTDDQSQI